MMKDDKGWWRMMKDDEGWWRMMMDDEGWWRYSWFCAVWGFCFRTNRQTDEQTKECECRVAFTTEKLIKNCLFVCKHLNIVFVTKNWQSLVVGLLHLHPFLIWQDRSYQQSQRSLVRDHLEHGHYPHSIKH